MRCFLGQDQMGSEFREATVNCKLWIKFPTMTLHPCRLPPAPPPPPKKNTTSLVARQTPSVFAPLSQPTKNKRAHSIDSACTHDARLYYYCFVARTSHFCTDRRIDAFFLEVSRSKLPSTDYRMCARPSPERRDNRVFFAVRYHHLVSTRHEAAEL